MVKLSNPQEISGHKGKKVGWHDASGFSIRCYSVHKVSAGGHEHGYITVTEGSNHTYRCALSRGTDNSPWNCIVGVTSLNIPPSPNVSNILNEINLSFSQFKKIANDLLPV